MINFRHLALIGALAIAPACSSTAKKSVPAQPSPAASPAPAASPTAPAAQKAAPTTPGKGLEISCQQEKDVRTITVVPAGSGCEVHYMKFGQSAVAASSANGTTRCDSVQTKIRGNLEASGFTCK